MPYQTPTDPRLLLLSPGDPVYVLRDQIAAGETVRVAGVAVLAALGLGHKIARLAIAQGEPVITVRPSVGRPKPQHPATMCIRNLKSDYTPTYALEEKA